MRPRSGTYDVRGVSIDVNVDEEAGPAYTLPSVLRFADGTPVTTREAWPARRAELLELFETHVYGRTPPAPGPIAARVLEPETEVLHGTATRMQVRVFLLGEEPGAFLDLLVYVPSGPGPHPVVLGLNFQGNHTTGDDPAIRLPEGPVRSGSLVEPKAVPASDEERGDAKRRWPVEEIVGRGYALATGYYGDIAYDDRRLAYDGLLGALSQRDPPPPDSWGAIGAWAFGLSRAMDWVAAHDRLDTSRVVVLGHSRLGKAALWAGAQDERFGMVVSNDSGCGGAALSRRRFGESVATINKLFPHWFSRRFHTYADNEDELPVDQHQLLALIAPRPLYVASAADDLWADPKGERLATEAAWPVADLLGTPRPGYHVRPGGHDLTLVDWNHFLDFADEHL